MTRNRSAIIALADAMRVYFAGLKLDVVVGRVTRTEYARTDNIAPGGAGRVLLIEPPNGDRGEAVRGRRRNNPDAILEWDRPFKLSVWGANNAAVEDEEEQESVTEDLLELALQALRRAVDPKTGQPFGFGNFHFGKFRSVLAGSQPLYGIELQLDVTLKTLLYDVELDVGTATPVLVGSLSRTPVTPVFPPPAIPNLTGGT